MKLSNHATITSLPFLVAVPILFIGYFTANQRSSPINTNIKVLKYKENICRNLNSLHAMFPAYHCTVNDQAASPKIQKTVTRRSAILSWNIKLYIAVHEGLALPRLLLPLLILIIVAILPIKERIAITHSILALMTVDFVLIGAYSTHLRIVLL